MLNLNLDAVSQDHAAAEFLGYNLEALAELAAFADFSQGFTIAFAEINFSGDAARVIAALKRHPACATIQFAEVMLDDPRLTAPLSQLKLKVAGLQRQPDRKLVLVVQGLEKSIGITGETSTPVLRDLNYTRDLFPAQMPHPIIFVLPDYALQRLAKTARDFWSWSSAVVRFQSAPQTVTDAKTQTLDPQRLYSSDLAPVKQERIDQLLRLLSENTPSPTADPILHAALRLNLLQELGDAYNSLSNLQQAKRYYRQHLELAEQINDQAAVADGLVRLGQILYRLDDQHQTALAYYDRARSLYQTLNNLGGEANTLQAIGDVLQFLDRRSEALENYDGAMEIYRQVGARLGEANTLKAIGNFYSSQEDYSQALAFHEQALAMMRQIGDRYGEAAALYYIGNTLARLDQKFQAVQAYEQARDICQSIHLDDLVQTCQNSIRDVGQVIAPEPLRAPKLKADFDTDSKLLAIRCRRLRRQSWGLYFALGLGVALFIWWLKR